MRRTRLIAAMLLAQALSACALATGLAIVGAAPALEPLVPTAPPIKAYSEQIGQQTITVSPHVRRACAAKPPIVENRTGVWRCATLIFAPQSSISSQTALRHSKTVIRRNPHMTPTNVNDATLIEGNIKGMSTNSPHVANSFSFPYYSSAEERTVFRNND